MTNLVTGTDGLQFFKIQIDRGKNPGYVRVSDSAFFATEDEMKRQQQEMAAKQRSKTSRPCGRF